MAKKLTKLSFMDIVLQADSETIREAYEARVKIDGLLEKREEAYRQIEAIELQVEEVVGTEGAFVYPAPPVPVAGFNKLVPVARPAKPKLKPVVEEIDEPEEEGELSDEVEAFDDEQAEAEDVECETEEDAADDEEEEEPLDDDR